MSQSQPFENPTSSLRLASPRSLNCSRATLFEYPNFGGKNVNLCRFAAATAWGRRGCD